MGYLKAIRLKCLDCASTSNEVKKCPMTDCHLYPFRIGKAIKGKSRLRAIRKKCLWCMNGNVLEIRLCQVPDCSLFKLRRAGEKRLIPSQEWPENLRKCHSGGGSKGELIPGNGPARVR